MVEKYNLDPSLCWMVGDKWIDVETGLKSKMNAALVRTGKRLIRKLKTLHLLKKYRFVRTYFLSVIPASRRSNERQIPQQVEGNSR